MSTVAKMSARGQVQGIGRILERLGGVKENGPGRWIACCPAHNDTRPSLALREVDDGKILLKCFAGCHVDDITASVGLAVSDLFPLVAASYERRRRERFHPGDVLACVAQEAFIVLAAASDLQRGAPMSAEDRERLSLAVERLQAAKDHCYA